MRISVTRVWKVAFWVAAIFALVMAALPQPLQMPGSPSDKIQHVIAFATLAALASAAYPLASLLKLLAGLSGFGAFIEVVQAIPQLNRDSDPVDWVADTIAAALVLAIVWWRRTTPPI